jgi:hypothetical protein
MECVLQFYNPLEDCTTHRQSKKEPSKRTGVGGRVAHRSTRVNGVGVSLARPCTSTRSGERRPLYQLCSRARPGPPSPAPPLRKGNRQLPIPGACLKAPQSALQLALLFQQESWGGTLSNPQDRGLHPPCILTGGFKGGSVQQPVMDIIDKIRNRSKARYQRIRV